MRLFFNKSFLLGFSLVCVLWMPETVIASQGFMAQQDGSSSPIEIESGPNPGEPNPGEPGG